MNRMVSEKAFEYRRPAAGGFGRGGGEVKAPKNGSDVVRAFRQKSREDGKPRAPAAADDEAHKQPDPNVAKGANGEGLDIADYLETNIHALMPTELIRCMSRVELQEEITTQITKAAAHCKADVSGTERKELETFLLNEISSRLDALNDDPLAPGGKHKSKGGGRDTLQNARETIQPLLMEHIDASAASELPRGELADQVSEVVGELLVQEGINLNLKEQRDLVTLLLNDMLGLGPLEPLLDDDDINDIMVNGPDKVYVEKHGKLTLTDVKFRSNEHLQNIATRIVTAVGRRVDETSPICDARLADGSRVNVIIPPLAIDGASISIRKFARQEITLDRMIEQENISRDLGMVLKVAAASRLNVLISGGTGSGKTTMLNAMSRLIDGGERIVTIEDAAELQLQQPHVVRLETRPPNLEGTGEVTMRDLVKNALRMRPDRIILGEIRGAEAVDMLQAMNTGHDGSLGTIHANRPREALTRLENMVGMAGINLPSKAVRTQIAEALDLIVQVARMRDGKRRVQYVTEVVGMEGDVITTQDLFNYKFTGEDEEGNLTGEFISSNIRPHFLDRAEYYNLGQALMNAMS